jgi:hypothetical protein
MSGRLAVRVIARSGVAMWDARRSGLGPVDEAKPVRHRASAWVRVR